MIEPMKKIAAIAHIKLFDKVLDSNWQDVIDEFIHNMWNHIREVATIEGYSYRQHTPTKEAPIFFFGYSPTSKSLTSEIAFVPTSEDLSAYVGITKHEEIEEQVDPWIYSLTKAMEKIKEGHPSHDWWSIISPVGTTPKGSQIPKEQTSIKGLKLTPSNSTYFEIVENIKIPSMAGGIPEYVKPTIVEGTSRGYSWDSASASAVKDLNKLCALLSVVFDGYWRIRESPHTKEHGKPWVPTSRMGPGSWEGISHEEWAREEVSVPVWTEQAWDAMEKNSSLESSVFAHYQGLALEEVSPSYALIAYVGAVEGFGPQGIPAEKCQCCPHFEAIINTGRRFREALKPVLSSKQRGRLTQVMKIYDRRSETAHAGLLHGGEMSNDHLPRFRMFQGIDPAAEFRYVHLHEMRQASRKLLIFHLKETSK